MRSISSCWNITRGWRRRFFALNANLSEGLIIFFDFFEPFWSSSTMLKTMLGQGTSSVK